MPLLGSRLVSCFGTLLVYRYLPQSGSARAGTTPRRRALLLIAAPARDGLV